MKIVIVGAGAVGTHLSKLLSREHKDCVLIDDNEERLNSLSEYDVMTYHASPTSIKAMKEAGKPVSAGDITKILNADRKEVDKAFAELKKDGAIVSPVRCKWAPAE